MCRVRKNPFEEQTISFLLKFGRGIYILEATKKSIQDFIGDVVCRICPNEKCVHLSADKFLVCTTVKSAKFALTCWLLLLMTKNRLLCCLVVMEHIALQGKRVMITEKEVNSHFWLSFHANHNQAHPNMNQRRQKSFLFLA